MDPLRSGLQRVSNSPGFLIPKSVLSQVGVEDAAELKVESGALVTRKPAAPVRAD